MYYEYGNLRRYWRSGFGSNFCEYC